jgi:polyhydroxyalkanoate synthase
VFVVSWVNPDEDYSDVGVDTYIQEGFLTAIEQVKKITKERQINAVGYCIAGTTLSLTLSHLAQRGDKSVKSATFFTTVTDFSEQREFTPFLQDDFVDAIEREVDKKGFLDSFFMSRTFSFLRSNDLIYQPAIRSYMMGETPPAFDLLYWNGDSTNLPAKMLVEYLRGLCQSNCFANGEGFDVMGETLKISDLNVPLFAVACETDHIANWQDSYRGVALMGSKDKTFVLSESGHIAGIINPPSKKKYGHYTNDAGTKLTSADWLESATYNEGSWWPRWEQWLAARSGKQVPARQIQGALCPAPGTYVVGAHPGLNAA